VGELCDYYDDRLNSHIVEKRDALMSTGPKRLSDIDGLGWRESFVHAQWICVDDTDHNDVVGIEWDCWENLSLMSMM